MRIKSIEFSLSNHFRQSRDKNAGHQWLQLEQMHLLRNVHVATETVTRGLPFAASLVGCVAHFTFFSRLAETFVLIDPNAAGRLTRLHLDALADTA